MNVLVGAVPVLVLRESPFPREKRLKAFGYCITVVRSNFNVELPQWVLVPDIINEACHAKKRPASTVVLRSKGYANLSCTMLQARGETLYKTDEPAVAGD